MFSIPVEDNVYTGGNRGIAGARGIVALDKDGKVLWVQCTAFATAPDPHFPSGGCGTYKNSPPPPPPPSSPVNGDGVTVIVRGAEVEARFHGISRETRQLLEASKQGRISLGCFKLVTFSGKSYSRGVGVYSPFSTIVRVRPYRGQTAPFDGCTATGMYGHSWNDAHGTHDAVEVPLTARARWRFETLGSSV